MLKNDININVVLQEPFEDRISQFLWKKDDKVYNKATFFCLPMINLSLEGSMIKAFLRNCYFNDNQYDHAFDENVLFVLFKVINKNDGLWNKFQQALKTKANYLHSYYVGKQGNFDLMMFVFEVPDNYKNDYQLIKNGQYSKTSSEYKSKFPQYILINDVKKESRIYGILNKTNSLKNELVKMFINPKTSNVSDVTNLRNEIDTWDEIWDKPSQIEIFR